MKDRIAWAWLALFAAAGCALALLYPDSYQQDGGNHFLQARWSFTHPQLFVGVWARPLFVTLYCIPAQFGYLAAKLFTVVIGLATAWQCWKLAGELELEKPHRVLPLLLFQPAFFLIFSDTMTEPLFALVLVIALRLHRAGRIKAGMLAASLLILARPEGFFVGVLWGFWVLFDKRDERPWFRRIPSAMLLATGAAIWCIAAWVITGDPLFIKHDWPHDWKLEGGVYGSGSALAYVGMLPQIAGPLLLVPFLLGMIMLLHRRSLWTITSPFLCILLVHSALWTYGGFGSAGYARYFVCTAPCIAIIGLVGWNAMCERLGKIAPGISAIVLAASGLFSIACVDGYIYTRDSRAIDDMHGWFAKNPRSFQHVVWSQAYMCIRLDADPWDCPKFTGKHDANVEMIRKLPAGTLVFWDSETGPNWYGLTAGDFKAAGFELLRSNSYALDGLIFRWGWFWQGGVRKQEMHLLIK